jgi:hypothetical protein
LIQFVVRFRGLSGASYRFDELLSPASPTCRLKVRPECGECGERGETPRELLGLRALEPAEPGLRGESIGRFGDGDQISGA